MGLLVYFAPFTFVNLVNRFAGWMRWSSALVIKSDTSLLLLKVRRGLLEGDRHACGRAVVTRELWPRGCENRT